jgi:hypothetical protein
MTAITTIEEYVAAVRAGLVGLRAAERDEALAELESLLRADAERVGEAAAVAALGDSRTYAAGVVEALGQASPDETDEGPQPRGRVLGMPYDFRGASVDRMNSRLWNPSDARIFMPRLFGVGWTVNFGALAVKLHLIRPDDTGDESFERIPSAAMVVALAVPVVLALATVTVAALTWSQLPAQVPIHWGASGRPDDWGDKALALGMLVAIAVVPVVFTYPRVLGSGTPARSRLFTAVALTLPGLIALGVSIMTVADADGGASGGYAWLVVLGALVVPFFMLYVPLRLGLRAEWRESGSHEQRRS